LFKTRHYRENLYSDVNDAVFGAIKNT